MRAEATYVFTDRWLMKTEAACISKATVASTQKLPVHVTQNRWPLTTEATCILRTGGL